MNYLLTKTINLNIGIRTIKKYVENDITKNIHIL